MRTLGIDAATHTGLALVGEGQDRGKLIEFKKLRGFRRLQLIAQEVDRIVDVWRPDLALIEAYAPNPRNMKTVITQVECGTVIKQVLYRRGLGWVEVKPSTLKKWWAGKGNVDKDGMAEAAKQRGIESQQHDIVDAFALAHLGASYPLEELLKIDGVTLGQ